VLETIRDLMQSELVVPDWLHNIFLGYGLPGSAHYTMMPNLPKEIDFRDTFLDYDHLVDSFPGKKIVPMKDFEAPFSPPYVLQFPESSNSNDSADSSNSKQDEVEAIKSGTNPGLTLIVGPPGTGKTDVAVQIIANLYHNFPDQHTLLVTHSNQALNQLFEKIMALDVDERHLLRLGHGEEELNTELSFSKYGRVNSFLVSSPLLILLHAQIDRLSQSLEIGGEHGYTCETAGYFYLYHVLSRWEPYIDKCRQGLENGNVSVETIRNEFPFSNYFYNAPQPLFPEDANYAETLEIAEGCFRHIEKIFTELEEIRGFELLRTSYDRANYLLTKEAKIIAMTSQILEVETFIPLLLQETEDGRSRLKRVVMIGDHNQLPPVVKNMAFQQYGNMEQSLFTRFVRLGVPTIDLDSQGRSRPSIAKLYNWRYKNLGDLPSVTEQEEYKYANSGFVYDYQVINVDNYMGKALIRDVLKQRCSWNPLFGRPAKVTTVDKFQGQQNDYVRRLIVAMSRARLGLYVFCRLALFKNCYELTPTFDELLKRPTKLSLKINEIDSYEVSDVEHIGKYVYQMMQEQLAYAKQQKAKSEDTSDELKESE
ncbi:203_t:CDS:10, partial [Racocetra fulgida]